MSDVIETWRVNPLSHPDIADAGRDNVDRAMVMVAAAKLLAGSPYQLGGRGPERFDNFGFVRACVQAATDWTPGFGYAVRPPIADVINVRDGVVRTAEAEANEVAAFVEAWGLERVDVTHPIPTLPGDIVMSLGVGPAAVIVLTGNRSDIGETVAAAWAPSGPSIRGDAVCGRSRVRVYRWPSAGAVV